MAIEEQAHELGYDVVFSQTLNMPEREQQVIRRMLSRRVEGLFITPVYRLEPTAPIYEELRRRGSRQGSRRMGPVGGGPHTLGLALHVPSGVRR